MVVVGSLLGLLFGLFLAVALILPSATVVPTFLIWLVPAATAFSANFPQIVLVAVLLYVVAHVLAAVAVNPQLPGPAPSGPATRLNPAPIELFMRGFQIGLTAGLNFGLLWMSHAWAVGACSSGVLSSVTCTLAIMAFPFAITALVLIMLGAIFAVSSSPTYQAALGWFGYVLPLTLPATILGMAIFLINLLIGLATGNRPGLAIDFTTGAVESVGGPFAALAPGSDGVSIGHFTFIIPPEVSTLATGGGISVHETGHTLNTAQFGSIFLLINAIDENVPPFARGAKAYGELLAESHSQCPNFRFIGHWG